MNEAEYNTTRFSGTRQRLEHIRSLKYFRDETDAAGVRRRQRLREMCFSSTRLKRRLSFFRFTKELTFDSQQLRNLSPCLSGVARIERKQDSSSFEKNNVVPSDVSDIDGREFEKTQRTKEQHPVHEEETLSDPPGIPESLAKRLNSEEMKKSNSTLRDKSESSLPSIVSQTVGYNIKG